MPSDRHEVLYSGSVKNVRAHTSDTLIFEFTDQVSVFDWGALPDLIPGKGEALVKIGALFFKALSHPDRWREFYSRSGSLSWVAGDALALQLLQVYCSKGLPTHFRGVFNEQSLSSGSNGLTGLIVEKVKIVRPEWIERNNIRTPQYAASRNNGELIPLEVVFRNKLVAGSSILKRRNDLSVGDEFAEPLVEFFTKLEPQDRPLSVEEAHGMSGLDQSRFNELIVATKLVASFLQFTFEQIDHGDGGIELIDGKFEWALSQAGELMLVDSIGPDELRLHKNGKDLSKETLREYYRNTAWYKELLMVKEAAAQAGDPEWKLKVKSEVPHISAEVIKQVSSAYTGLANHLDRYFSSNANHGDRVLLIGSGGREHALAWRILKSPCSRSLIWPGNNLAAVEHLKKTYPNKEILIWEEVPSNGNLKALAEKAKKEAVTFAVIGPDAYLEAGITDVLNQCKVPTFGPTRAAAELEWSKSFAKAVMEKAGVPTAKSWTLNSVLELTHKIKALDWTKKWVIKVDTLAAGKGVEVCENSEQALASVDRLSSFGNKFVLEEFLTGTEVSVFAFCDGDSACVFEPARDFKTLNDFGKGPNTGGMGAITPVPDLNSKVMQTVLDTVFKPVLREMKKQGRPYHGLLYAGLMVSGSEYYVLEFNARFGDPETQALLPRFKGDFLMWLKASAEGKLSQFPAMVSFDHKTSVYVVAASDGYPDQPRKGDPIEGLQEWINSNKLCGFISGVQVSNTQTERQYITHGGRVLGALGISDDPQEAARKAYLELSKIKFLNMHFRKDVGPIFKNIVILASGRGSNFEALAGAVRDKKLNAKILSLICNKKNAPVLGIASKLGIPTVVIHSENDLLSHLKTLKPDYIVLAGYDRIISKALIDEFRDHHGKSRIINIHPSLLPEFKGLHAYHAAFQAGVKKTGVSIHRVEPELDSGPLIAQEEFSIAECKNPEEVESLGLKIEHELYPKVLSKLFREQPTC